MTRTAERWMSVERVIQLRDQLDHIGGIAPVEIILAVDVDLLPAVPFYAVRNSPRALPGEERGQLHAQPRIGLAALRQPIVVMSLGEMHERAELLATCDRTWQIPLELSAIISLKDLGIGPVEVGIRQQRVRHPKLATESLKHEDGVRIFLADSRDDVLPGVRGNHIASIAPKSVDTITAPEDEHIRHIGAELGIGIVELHEIRPFDAPGTGRMEPSVGLVIEPVRMMSLQGRSPARVIGGKIDEEQSATRMHAVDELTELVKRRRELVELRHRRIDGIEISGGERTAVLAHHRIGRRHRERRQRLDDLEAHLVHDQRQPPRDFAEGAELTRKHGVDRTVPAQIVRLHLDMEIVAIRPFRNVGPIGEETRLAGEHADLIQGNVDFKHSGAGLCHRDIRPGPRQRHLSAFGLGDDLTPPHLRTAEIRAERRAPFARMVQGESYGKDIALPLQQKFGRIR